MNKRIWITSDSEPIPEKTKKGRLMRAGKFANYAVDAGYDVTWWATTWMHYEKRFIFDKQTEVTLKNGVNVKLLHAKKAYSKNVSVSRILYCNKIAKEFKKEINKLTEKPDYIICSWPLIEMTYYAVKYAKKNNIPVVIDIRDAWPDIFVQPFSGLMRFLVKLVVNILYRHKVSYSVKNAYKVIGVTNDCLSLAYEWGRKRNEIDAPLYLSTTRGKYDKEVIAKAKKEWEKKGVSEKDYVVTFIGSIQSRIVNFDPIVNAAKKMPNVKFVLVGDGYSREELINTCKELPNVIFPGYLDEVSIIALSEIAIAGLLPYRNTPDFINSLPNKLGEYLSNGLPVLTHLKGDSRTLLETKKCGAYYSNEDDLAREVARLIEDKEYLKEARNNALKVFDECFNADVTYKGLFDSLMNNKEAC